MNHLKRCFFIKLSYAIKFIMKKSKGSIQIPALDRGLDLIEWFAKQSEPATLTQIAQGLSLSVSEVQRPVACLYARGYLNRSSSAAYLISGKIVDLAQALPVHFKLRQAAHGPMAVFARTCGESIHLSVPDGDAALLLLDVPGGSLVRLSLQEGARLDPVRTVSGRILLAHGAILNPESKQVAPSVLARIRKLGYESARSFQVEGITDTGVPVRNGDGKVVAALAISCLKMKGSSKSAKTLLKGLLLCAETISDGI